MYFSLWSSLLLPLTVVIAAPTSLNVEGRAEIEDRASGLFSNVDIYDAPGSYNSPGTLYARTVELPNGDLLATWENYSPEPPNVYFPIHRSTNGGKSWSFLSSVVDTVNNFGLRYQPFLYVLPSAIGGFSAGTLLLAGNSIPKDLSITQIDLYASTDSGKTWRFVSHIARGGEALPNNGLTPVWEPFLLLHNGQLICYYSDQRDPKHGQKLVHQTTNDLKNWAGVVDDVAYSTYTDRPGMTTVAALPNGKWIMTYEYGGTDGFKVHSRVSSSPLTFNSGTDSRLTATDGSHLDGSPYIVWSSQGGSLGTLVVSCGTSSNLFISRDLGKTWKNVAAPQGTSYTRSLRVITKTQNHLLIVGAMKLSGHSRNSVIASMMDLNTV